LSRGFKCVYSTNASQKQVAFYWSNHCNGIWYCQIKKSVLA